MLGIGGSRGGARGAWPALMGLSPIVGLLLLALVTDAAPGPVNPQLPAGGWFSNAAYDSSADRIILYGGDTYPARTMIGEHPINETWSYDYESNTWQNLTTTSNPGPRFGHAMAYDAKSDRTVLFGGGTRFPRPGNAHTWFNDTWAFDYNNNTWRQLATNGTPQQRAMAQMVYDSQSDRMIMFGGYGAPFDNSIDDTWTFDFDNLTWTAMAPSVSPSPRVAYSMAYDSASDRAILFGGWNYPTEMNDTFAYDFETDSWQNMTSGPSPPARDSAAMTYDGASGRTLLFGGSTVPELNWADTWTFDYPTHTWARVDASPSPPPTTVAVLSYDSLSSRAVLFGGVLVLQNHPTTWAGIQRQPLNHTWAFDGATSTWKSLDRPPAVDFFSTAGGQENVSISWSQAPPPVGMEITGFNLYRGLAPSNLTLLVGGLGNTSFLDTQVVPNITYWYAVAALSPAGEGWLSPVQPATPAPKVAPDGKTPNPDEGGIGSIFTLPGEASAVVLIAIVASFLAGVAVGQYVLREFRKPPEE